MGIANFELKGLNPVSTGAITGGILNTKLTDDNPLISFSGLKPVKTTDLPSFMQPTPSCISGYTLPDTKWGGAIHYSDEEVDAAQEEYANLSPQEQADMQKIYEKGMEEYNRMKSIEAVGTGLNREFATMEEFLADNPEFKQAFAVMGPIAQDYNEHLTEVANEYIENAPLAEKILLKLGIATPGMKAAMEGAKQEYAMQYEAKKLEKEEVQEQVVVSNQDENNYEDYAIEY